MATEIMDFEEITKDNLFVINIKKELKTLAESSEDNRAELFMYLTLVSKQFKQKYHVISGTFYECEGDYCGKCKHDQPYEIFKMIVFDRIADRAVILKTDESLRKQLGI